MRGRWTDRRNWPWLPRRLRFRVFGLIDVIALWVLVGALVGGGAWWGADTYLDQRNYCSADHDLRREGDECIGVTARPDAFGPDLDSDVRQVLERIENENAGARKSAPQKQVVSVAVVMPYTAEEPGAAMSKELILHALQGAYVAQYEHNHGSTTKGTAIQLLFANVGESLDQWRDVTKELKSRTKDEVAPLVAAIGFPNSDSETLDSVQDLGKHRIPAVSAVLSSTDMEDPYLFKVSPSNSQLVDALKEYVKRNGVNRERTFMIADDREDNYVSNLREVLRKKFGADYGITDDPVRRSIEMYQGEKGPKRGDVQDFRESVEAMCDADTRTVFLAGRDADLQPFLEAIDETNSCRYRSDDPLRILRVSTARDPDTESPTIGEVARRLHIRIVTAAAVDAPRWERGEGETPRHFGRFESAYERSFTGEGRGALNDGYAVMYHDALAAVSNAVKQAGSSSSGDGAVTHDDVQDQLRKGSPQDDCAQCVQAASGDFTFVDADESDARAGVGQWPVCKPVPIVTFPERSRSESPLYRTYESAHSKCPAA
ncbi:ABC transporter substrate-binding protein [Streptomyces sp. NPDC102381]|uniref:ABC transporter substrate-binding protein n=1 Tax=Streptomyces sp. NPDC102381 TaxID=3366164 RepID=UPI0037FE580C